MKMNLIMPVVAAFYLLIAQSCAIFVCEPGLSFGPQFSTVLGGESWENSLGAQLGISNSMLAINESMSVRGEVNISSQGARWSESEMSGKVSLLYLNAPFVLKYQNINGFFLEAGLQPGLLLRARDSYEGSSYDYKANVKTIDFGVPLGVGYKINDKIDVGLRVIPGISNINKGEYSSYSKDRNFIIALRGMYTLKKR